jgi:ribosomal protein S18 acetylase RimI-like enzyme
MAIDIREASSADDARLSELDRVTWSGSVTPAARWPADRRFFAGGLEPGDVLVAEADGVLVGYARLQAPTPLPSNRHVLELRGLAVEPAYQGSGIGRRLLLAAIEQSARRGARRLTLRVLATNDGARRLYGSLGFEVEGVLREEFLIDGRYVDDVLMAIELGGSRPTDSGRPSSASG